MQVRRHPKVSNSTPEQNAQMALAIADRAYVLETGKITMQGKGDDLLQDPNLIQAYLGGYQKT